MSTWWRSGDFDRDRISTLFHAFTPAHAADSLVQIDLQRLWDRGKRLLLIDVDNTLVEWKAENFAPAVIEWLEKAKNLGFEICIISNTKRVDRLARISELLKVETVRGRFKPSRAMFRLALVKFKRKPHEAIMIGDQMMTDILGANRSGIEAIWVRRMEGKEFGPTAVNRFMERLLTSAVYRALVAPVDEMPDAAPVEQAKPLGERTIVHQIVKFCIVGGTSFLIDFGLTLLFLKVLPWDGALLSERLGAYLRNSETLFGWATGNQQAAMPILGGLASFIAMFNSFWWNRHWTFEVRGKEQRLRQLRRFYTVSILGMGWNVLITTIIFNISHGQGTLLAKVVAAGVVAVWNFSGQRLYAFRPSRAA